MYICNNCGNTIHRDTNTSINILNRGLKSFGLGISLLDYKQKALAKVNWLNWESYFLSKGDLHDILLK